MGGWWRWALVGPDGVAPSRMVSVSASVNLPLHHKVQKFSSGTGSPGWSRKKALKRLWCGGGSCPSWLLKTRWLWHSSPFSDVGRTYTEWCVPSSVHLFSSSSAPLNMHNCTFLWRTETYISRKTCHYIFASNFAKYWHRFLLRGAMLAQCLLWLCVCPFVRSSLISQNSTRMGKQRVRKTRRDSSLETLIL